MKQTPSKTNFRHYLYFLFGQQFSMLGSLIVGFTITWWITILGIDSINENTNRISFIVTFKKKTKLLSFRKRREVSSEFDSKAELLSDVQKISFISNIKVIDGSNSIEI